MYAASLDGGMWRSADVPAWTFRMRFRSMPTEEGEAPVLVVDTAVVSIESDGDGFARFVLDRSDADAPGRSYGRWWLAAPGVDQEVAVVDEGARLGIRAAGDVLGRSASVGSDGSTVVPRYAFGDVTAATGAALDILPAPIEVRSLCIAASDGLLQATTFGEALPPTSAEGELVALAACRAMYLGTGDPRAPWQTLEVAPIDLSVVFPDGPPGPGAWLVLADPTGFGIGARIESDGRQVRVRVGAPFVEVVGPWRVVERGGWVDLAVGFDSTVDGLRVFADGQQVGVIPATTKSPTDPTQRVVIMLEPVRDPGGGMVIEERETEPLRLCTRARSLHGR